jgi:hypothetical protein
LALFLWIFLRRGLHKQFPFFFCYVVFQLFDFLASAVNSVLAELGPSHSLNVYRWVMASDVGIGAVISFGVIYDLVSQLILSRSGLAQILRSLLRWSGGALLFVIAATSGRLAVAGGERAMNVFQVLDFSSSGLQLGLLLVLLVFSRVLRVCWRSLPVGIAVGLGMEGCVELSAAGLFSVFGPRYYVAIDLLRLATFHVCVLVWLGYLLFPKREAEFIGAPMQKSDLEFWDEELQRMVRR